MSFEERHPGLKSKHAHSEFMSNSWYHQDDIDDTQLDKQFVKKILIDYFGNPEEYPPKQPTHGTCCTCQDCGWDYDSCKCLERKLWKELGL